MPEVRVVAFDIESDLIRPGSKAPEIACLSFDDGTNRGVIEREHCARWFRDHVRTCKLVAHNASFDVGGLCAHDPSVMLDVFTAYEEGRISDTQTRAELIDLAEGHRGWEPDYSRKRSYHLADLARRMGMPEMDKDTHRLSFGMYRWQDKAEWPAGAEDYSLFDSTVALRAYRQQEGHRALVDEANQNRNAWVRHLMSTWGLRTNREGVEALRVEAEEHVERTREALKEEGLIRPDGTRDMKAIAARISKAWEEQGLPVRMTKEKRNKRTGKVSGGKNPATDSDACEACGDPLMLLYSEYVTNDAILTKDVAALLLGVEWPVHSRFNWADSGRSTSSGPNVQNWRGLVGIRECFVPRPGRWYAQADFNGLELRTIAEACLVLLGESRLAEVLNSGRDPHTEMAALILGIPPEEAYRRIKDPDVKEARQTAKVANFGFPGGLGPDALILFAWANYGVRLTKDRAIRLKVQWFEMWPEMRKYFRLIESFKNGDRYDVVQLYSNRIRGGCSFTAAANTIFQGLGADANHRGLWHVSRACYVEPRSPLYGCRPVNNIHDENILEVPNNLEEGIPAAKEMSLLMCRGADEYIKNVPTKAPAMLMKFWSKEPEKTGALVWQE